MNVTTAPIVPLVKPFEPFNLNIAIETAEMAQVLKRIMGLDVSIPEAIRTNIGRNEALVFEQLMPKIAGALHRELAKVNA